MTSKYNIYQEVDLNRAIDLTLNRVWILADTYYLPSKKKFKQELCDELGIECLEIKEID